MIPEREYPQDGGDWTKIDGGWRRGLGRTMVGPSGVIREKDIFFYDSGDGEQIQRDILLGGDLIRVISKDNILAKNPEDIALVPFVDRPKEHIRIINNKTKTSLVLFSEPNGTGEEEERCISFKKGILDADETAFYFNFGRYCSVEGDAFYSDGNIQFIQIMSKIDDPGGGPVIVHQDISMESIAPEITVYFGDNNQIYLSTADAIEGRFGDYNLEFFASQDRRLSKVIRPFFGSLERQNLEVQLQDVEDRFVLEFTDTTTKKTIRVSAAKKVDFDSLYSTASTPEYIGWEKALEDVDNYFSVDKD